MRSNSKGGRHTVFGDYLLTGKLFCGECGSPMTGVSGTSHTGQSHFYYVCNKKKNKKCTKKNVRRDAIEKSVALAIRKYILKDDVIEWIADMVVDYQSKQKDNPEIALLHSQLAEVKLSIKNIIKAIEAGIITDSTKDRLRELEDQQANIASKISAAEYNLVEVNRDYVVAWLQSFRNGNVEDKEYMNNLFSSFVSAVYVYDDKHVKVVFSIGGSGTKSIDIALLDGHDDDQAQGSFKDCSGVPKQSQTNHQIVMINGVFVLSYIMR